VEVAGIVEASAAAMLEVEIRAAAGLVEAVGAAGTAPVSVVDSYIVT
jgi:hypothetical protein